MKRLKGVLAGAICTAVFIGAGSAASAATTLFSDLGPGGSYNGNTAYNEFGSNSDAFSFVATASGSIDEIELALFGDSGVVNLWTDNAGGLGAELGSWSVNGMPSWPGSGLATTTVGTSGVQLVQGDTYFLQVAASGSGSFLWSNNSQGVGGARVRNGSLINANAGTAAFEILGSAVPEPATWAAMILGMGMVGWAIRRRNAGAVFTA